MLFYNIMEDGLEQHRSLLLELERLQKKTGKEQKKITTKTI